MSEPSSKNAGQIVDLAEQAMSASAGKASEAAVMLMDAAIAIALTRFGSRADEIAGHLAAYIVQQVSHVTGEAGNA